MKTQGARNREAGKRAERNACRWALEHTSGLHEAVKEIATKTGRVGNYTNLEIDGEFVEYSLESKSCKNLPEWLRYGIVDQAVAAAKRFKNHPLVVVYSKTLPVDYRVWHMITPDRHAELLRCEQRVADAEADRDLMIEKFNEDLANAIDSWEAGQRT